jgi:cyclopropane fatty-acyl-phospholipid synthase-like methyltransferase
MDIRIDPENSESLALSEYADLFTGKRVLEIGCGDGRVTQLIAPHAAFVHAIDPDSDDIAEAEESFPTELRHKVHFEAVGIEAFSSETRFDAALLSWSL